MCYLFGVEICGLVQCNCNFVILLDFGCLAILVLAYLLACLEICFLVCIDLIVL